jgi:ribosomal protein S12 methylthiotransferase
MNMAKAEKISVNFISLGCPKNLVDSEVMVGLLDADDFDVKNPDEPTTVTVINSCSFIEDSKSESIDTILEVAENKKKGHCQIIVVAGCLAQRYAEKLPELLPEVDLFIGTGEYHKLAGLIRHKLAGDKGVTYVEKPEFIPDHLTPRKQSTPFYTKYVKIAEGCSHRCSFCIIPYLRGDLHSRKPDDIVQEIQQGVNAGVKEFNLVSQDLNEYGRDLTDRPSLYKLLQGMESIEGDFWLRLMYMYPLQFPDKLVKLIADHPHIAKYVDIPLQHISDPMLKKMNRGSSSKYIYRLVENLKKDVPDIAIRTTFIVGHPGETEDDFKQLKDFIQQSEFDRVGIFQFSNEEGTPSFNMKPAVPEDLAKERRDELMAMQKEISLKKNKALIGKTLKVLFEGKSDESELLMQGRYYGQAPGIDGVVLIRDGKANLGDFCDVKIVDAFEYDLLGEIVE